MSSFQRTAVALLLAVTVSSHAETVSIPLSGTATGSNIADLVVNPPLVDAGTSQAGLQTSVQIELRHVGGPGDTDLLINSIEVNGENAGQFSHNFSGPARVAAGTIEKIDVQFAPVDAGSKTAYLRIDHNGAESPHIILLTGTGTTVPQSQLATDTGTEKNFGTTTPSQPLTQNITISNDSSEANAPPVTIFNVVLSGPDASSYTTTFTDSVTLAPQQSIDIAVTLSSSITGSKTAQLQIQHDGENAPLNIQLLGAVNAGDGGNETEPEFKTTELFNAWPFKPTTLAFGPDNALYVAEQSGLIHRYEVDRISSNTYSATATETISLIQSIPNHNDDGTINTEVNQRLVTGIAVAGSASDPIVYVTSGDPRIGAGPSGTDLGLDTNSGMISKLVRSGTDWVKIDLVRGLPRSEENHQPNGMQLSADGNTLFVAMGGNTNMGAPSNNFAGLPEYAYSAAIVSVDLVQIGDSTLDLPTLDDEDRPGSNDFNDPFGGNNGKNMAILQSGSPLQIYAPGFRNAFDILIASNGKMYTVDNGPNSGWGPPPGSDCLNDFGAGGQTFGDGLHFIDGPGYYGGHPNPTRGNAATTFNASNPQSPLQVAANPIECSYQIPQTQDGALHVFNSSTNGLAEYTASNFGGSMQGDLLAASFDQSVHRVQLNADGNQVTGIAQLLTGLGIPLDVIAVGDSGPFPGTIWVADYSQNKIHIFEPIDY